MKNGDTSAFASPGIPGMTKRELIAAMLMAGHVVGPKQAIEMTDALLKALEAK